MKKIRLFILLLPALLLASCGQADDWGTDSTQPDDPQKIRFEMVHATATAVQGDSGEPRTRVATDTEYNSTWQTGDKVGLYIVKGTGALQSTGNWVDNIVMTYNGTGWDYTLPADREYYPKDSESLSFYAYHPYKDGVDPLNMTFAVQTDQSTAESFAKSYLLSAKTENVAKSNDPVQLDFAHKLAMVRVGLYNGEKPWEQAPGPADVVTLKSRYPNTTLNLSTGQTQIAGGEPSRTDIKMHYNTADWHYYALLAPGQEISNDTHLLDISWTNLLDLKHTHKGATYTLAGGEVKPLAITVKLAALDPDHEYAVGDVYPHKGFPAGVVFYVSADGKNGKIVSLNESVDTWSPTDVETGATSENDGVSNMLTVYTVNSNSFNNYPAFEWVHQKNPSGTVYEAGKKGIWYLPAKAELSALYSKLSEVNKTLSDNQWSTLRANTNYWSSTEGGDTKAWYIVFLDGFALPYPKGYSTNVRAVLAF